MLRNWAAWNWPSPLPLLPHFLRYDPVLVKTWMRLFTVSATYTLSW